MKDLERRIAAALAAGDLPRAADEALRGYGAELCGWLAGVLQDEEAAREVFSAVAERLWRDLPRFRGEASFRTWAYRVAWAAVGAHRRDPFRRRARPLDDDLHPIAETVRSITALHARTSIKDRVAKLREKLTDEERALLILRIDRDLSWQEVTAILSESTPVAEAAVRKRFERLKRKIRELARADGLP